MSPRVRLLAIGAFAGALSLPSRPLSSQGITSAALQGSVVQADGRPIGGAIVTLTAATSGAHWQVTTDAAGRYFLENVEVGGPYALDARALGFRPARRTGIVLTLGQRARADVALEPAVIELDALTVRARVDPALNPGRTGPALVVSQSELAALPNAARDLSVAAALDPLVALRPLGGLSISGQNQGFNSFQVDGGTNADLYLGRLPGGASPSGALPEVIPHAISLETVREFQVLTAPFDVRVGSFAGGLLNAVTKSGTNAFHGSTFAFLQDGGLMAKDAVGNRSDFTTWQFGGTFSGPIVRDRVHFFLNADLEQRVVPDAGFLVAADTIDGTDVRTTGVSYARALQFQQILRDSFGLEPGSLGPSNGHLLARDVFAKVTVQLGSSGHLEVSQRYAHGDRREFIDTGRTNGIYSLSSVAGHSASTARTSRLIWNALMGGRAQNELIVSHEHLKDSCRPNGTFPLIQVSATPPTLLAGPNSVCPTTAIDQQAVELTENLTVGVGRHLVTLGTHGELLDFHDPVLQVSAGRWIFGNLDSLALGLANHYDRGLPDSVRPPGADFHVVGLGVYAQDRWAATPRVTLTAGLRLDVPFLPDATATNPGLVASPLSVDTSQLPSGNVQWSPRVGINYDVSGDGTAFLRGGIGLFSGPPPYRWLGNAYRETGDETVVFCGRPDVPRFVPDSQPTHCPSGGGRSPRISFFDSGLRFPQNLKLALGVDRQLPSGVVATLDFLYTRAVHQIYVNDANLGTPTGAAAGEGGRPLYGSLDATGRAHPMWRDSAFGEIYRVSNRGGDHSFSLSTQVRKRFGEMLALYVAYAYSDVEDRMSWVNFPARANFSNTPLDGTLGDRPLRPSLFETPHKGSVLATVRLPYRTHLSLLYQGASQPPYTYVIQGDANADGIGGPGSLLNDAVYVPRNGSDMSLVRASDSTRLQAFIEQQRCLREQRGRILARNSCRNAWLGSLNARLTTTLRLAGDQRLEITADIFNVPNLINSRWGRYLDATTSPSVRLLQLRGWDTANARGIYQLVLPARGLVADAASRWWMQLGARYGF